MGGRGKKWEGKEAATPPSLALGVCPAPVRENLRQVSQMQEEGPGHPSCSLLTGYFCGETPLRLTPVLEKGSLWQRYPNT